MSKWLKRIRGAVGMGLIWGVAWSPVGAIMGLLFGGLTGFVSAGVSYALNGFLAGGAFSVFLTIVEGRRTFDEMSIGRFAVLGGGTLLALQLASFALLAAAGELPLNGPQLGVVAALATMMGAGCAAGSLALARRADDRDLLDAGGDVEDVGLTQEEKRTLLGG